MPVKFSEQEYALLNFSSMTKWYLSFGAFSQKKNGIRSITRKFNFSFGFWNDSFKPQAAYGRFLIDSLKKKKRFYFRVVVVGHGIRNVLEVSLLWK